MKTLFFKNGISQVILVIALSGLAVIFLNSLSFGFNFEMIADSLINTFIIASSVCLGILPVIPAIQDFSLFKRILIMTAIISITALVGTFVAGFLMRIFTAQEVGIYYLPSRRTITFSLVISYIFGFSTYFYLSSQEKYLETKKLLRQKELDEARAKSLAVQAQLASLESKIHPHFLFNTLNSIAALIKENPDEAEKMVEKLSALLRYSLDAENAKGLVSLEKELEITRKYLEIEKARFADRLSYKFDLDENSAKINVPPLSLQTLVENSIKHVASKSSKKTEIAISAFQNNGNFFIEVKDNGAGFSDNELKNGHGLDNLQKRLKNIFDENADLEIANNGAGGKVRLKIPFSNE